MPRPAPDARRVAHDLLLRVEATDAFADVLLAHRLAGSALRPADRALATQLVYGTLAWQARLDHHLAGLLTRPLRDLDPTVRGALRLGLYQLLFLDRVPAHAAVDASVRLAHRRGRGAAGLVNAVLRRAARAGRDGLPLPDADDDPIGRLAIEWSHPRWLVERWAAELGIDELPALLAADNVRGGTTLRAHRPAIDRDALLCELANAGVDARPGRFAPDAIRVGRGGGRLRDLEAFRAGRFAFQGEASQLASALVAPASGARVLDACAAPGGKTTHLAAMGAGVVVATDRQAGGLARLAAEAARLRLVTIRPAVAEMCAPPLRASFDAVLVDAPCSGLGTLRRHPELRWRRQPDDVARLARLQGALLAGVAPLVRPGGTLVYAVCTLTVAETAGVVERFLATSPGFVVEPAGRWLPGAGAVVTPEGFLRTLPHRHDLDGFFAVRLRAAG